MREHIYANAEEWRKEGERRFRSMHMEDWKFKCPACGRINTGIEFKKAGASPEAPYQECIGRYDKTKGCNWAAYGLFDICTAEVDGIPVFEFADENDCAYVEERKTNG